MRARVRLQRALSLIELTEFGVGAAEIDELLPDLDGADEIDALLGRARASIWLEQPDEGFAAAARAKQLAEEQGDAERVPAAIALMTGMLTLRGEIDEAIARGEEAVRRWVPGARPRDLAVANEFLSDVYYWSGNYERAEELARRAYEIGGEEHSVEPLLRGGGWRGVSLAALGRTEEAIAFLQGLIETSGKIGLPRFGVPSMNYLSLPFRDLFLIDEARRLNEEALEVVRKEGGWGMPGMQAEIDLMITDLLEGDVGRAQKDWPRLWDEAINGKTWRPWLGGSRLAYVRALLAQQSEGPEATLEAATDSLERATRARRRKYQALSRAIIGAALFDLGRADEGIAQLETAVAESDQLGTPSLRWQHRAALGRIRYATGDDEGAARAYREAGEIIRTYADALSAEHAEAFLSSEPVREVLKA
jgi:tetratricopeptide (TPR) repeat protein